jgi:hypothetical protein
MNRIVLVLMLSILGLVPGVSLGQSFGVPDGTRFQPVPGGRFDPYGASLNRSDDRSGKQKAKAKPKASRPAPAKKPTTTKKPVAQKEEAAEEEEAPEVRTWTDDTGKHTVQASFVALETDQVTLQKADGKEITLPLARLSKNDQQLAKTESHVWEIMDEYGEKIAEARAKHKKLEAEKKRLDAKKNQSKADMVRAREIVDEELSLSTEIGKSKEERDQKVRKLYNEYSAATGQEPLYVDDGWGKLESREVLAKREKDRKEREEVAKVSGTPRLAADNYVKTLLGNGTLREAAYLSEQFVTPGPQRSSMDRALGQAFGVGGGGGIGPIADPTKWKAVYYRVKYVSQAGLLIEKDAYVLTCRKENARVVGPGARPEDGAVWGVEGLHIDGVTE